MYTILDIISLAKSPNIAFILTTNENSMFALEVELFKES